MNCIHQLLQRCVHCVAVCFCVPYSHKYIQSSPQHFDCRVSGSAYSGTDSQFMNTETACLHGCTLDCCTTNPQSEILYFITFCMTFMCTWQGRTCLLFSCLCRMSLFCLILKMPYPLTNTQIMTPVLMTLKNLTSSQGSLKDYLTTSVNIIRIACNVVQQTYSFC